jgi:ElaB/YqjD/DUF883 family membrane-anchored ribosome-binding protein
MAEGAGQIRKEIEDTWDELAGTIEGLVGKADVKGRITDSAVQNAKQVQQVVTDVGERVRTAAPERAKAGVSEVQEQVQRRPWLVATSAAAVIAVAVLTHRVRRKGS